MRASNVAFPSASARSLPWGLIPQPSLMIKITGCAIRRRLGQNTQPATGVFRHTAAAAGGAGTTAEFTRRTQRAMAIPTESRRYRSESGTAPATRYPLPVTHNRFNVCRFKRRLFSAEIILPAAALFNFVVLFAHAYRSDVHTLRRKANQAPAGSNFAPARWANSTWNCDGWGAGPFSWVRPQ